MSWFRCRLPRYAALARSAAVLLLAFAACLPAIAPARAYDLFATHEVTAQFATPAGRPLANAVVRVFAPGDSATAVETGHTDSHGKFVFDADRDGMWTAEARTRTEVARVMIRVGGPAQQHKTRLPLFVVIGALILLVAIAWWYQILRARSRRQP